MFVNTVKELLENALEERQDLFLIDFSMTPDQAIKIIIDGDNGVRVEDCMFVSRAIEHNVDRDEHDFALEVMSAGAAASLILPRQFKKNEGRVLEVRTNSGDTFEGDLVNVTNETIELQWKAREPKLVGKGKITVQKNKTLAFSEIADAKVVIKF